MNSLVAISDVKIKKRFRQNPGDLKSLKTDITKQGLLQPIVIDVNHILVAGWRRLLSCKELNWKNISCTVIDPNIDVKSCEISENTERINFTISEIAAIAEYIKKTRIGHRPKKGANLAPFSKGKTRDIVAKLADISPAQAQKIIDLGVAAKNEPEKFKSLLDDIDSKKKSVDTAYQSLQTQTRKPTTAKIPKGQWNVFEFDFPWGYRNENIGRDGGAAANRKYPTMPPKDILEKQVPQFKKIIAKDAVIFMWVTTPLLNEIIQLGILEELGFTYKTMITWHKKIPKWFFGGKALGFWFNVETEHCLVGVKGNVKPFRSNLPNFIETEILPHSQKPDEFRILFEESTKFIPGRKLFEGFARRPRKNWTGYGNQLQKEEHKTV